MSLEITTRQAGTAVVLDLVGRITAGVGAATLRDQLRRLAEEGRVQILLNFEEVAFLDSAGLGALVVEAEQLRARGGTLRILNAHGPVRHVLQITRLDRVFPQYADEAAALAGLR